MGCQVDPDCLHSIMTERRGVDMALSPSPVEQLLLALDVHMEKKHITDQ